MEDSAKITPEPIRERPLAEVVAPGPAPSRPRSEPPRGPQELTLAEVLWIIGRGRWLIVAVTFAAVAGGGLYLAAAVPVYRASMLMQVEHRPRTTNGIDEVPGAPVDRTTADAETENLRSRIVLGTVLDALHAERILRPRRFPLIGRAVATLHRGPEVAPAPAPWLARFAWGGERIAVDTLEVGPELVDEPLLLRALEGDRFQLLRGSGVLLEGRVGERAEAGAQGERIALRVTELVARPGTEFQVLVRPRDEVIEAVRSDLRIQEKGKASGMLLLELDGPDPARIVSVLEGITTEFLRKDAVRKSDEAARKLRLVESQLPPLRQELDRAEAAVNDYRIRNGTVNLGVEAKALLDRSGELSKELVELELSRSEMLQGFREGHPAVGAANVKLARLQAEQEAVSARLRALPQAEATLARLETVALHARDVHDTLARKAQELRLAKAATLPDGWVVDPPSAPSRPVSPQGPLVVLLSLLVGALAGTATVLARAAGRTGAEDPEGIEAATGLPVYAIVPHSDREAGVRRKARRPSGAPIAQLFDAAPGDRSMEAIRALRGSVQHALAGAPNGIVAILAPVPDVGRSFVVTNLAVALAAAGTRTLLVDADLRHGRLQRLLGLKPSAGLAGVLGDGCAVGTAIVRVDDHLHVLPAGEIPARPGELLAARRFEALLLGQASRYDVVVVNTPPALAVADALAVGRLAGVNLMVVRAGLHGERELALAARQLEVGGVRLDGFVLNDVRARGGRYGRGGRDREYALDWRPAHP
jgi:tyrosine-protein kinase Etk/Wzc